MQKKHRRRILTNMSFRVSRAVWVLALIAVACNAPASAPPAPPAHSPANEAPTPELATAEPAPVPTPSPPQTPADPREKAAINAWFEAVGAEGPPESFGSLITRAARVQLGRPYFNPPQSDAPERLRLILDRFQCVSLVEHSLAIARCVAAHTPNSTCFITEVQATRYRHGRIDGYGSRLHYFADWLADNDRRQRIQLLGSKVGASSRQLHFDYMTARPHRYPALARPEVRSAIAAAEARLSQDTLWILDRDQLPERQHQLQEGDIIGVVDAKPGIAITHTGLVTYNGRGVPQVLHASSHHRRVLISAGDVAGYIARQPRRQGVMVARPLAPGPT